MKKVTHGHFGASLCDQHHSKLENLPCLLGTRCSSGKGISEHGHRLKRGEGSVHPGVQKESAAINSISQSGAPSQSFEESEQKFAVPSCKLINLLVWFLLKRPPESSCRGPQTCGDPVVFPLNIFKPTPKRVPRLKNRQTQNKRLPPQRQNLASTGVKRTSS